jgi:hypothetical protein
MASHPKVRFLRGFRSQLPPGTGPSTGRASDPRWPFNEAGTRASGFAGGAAYAGPRPAVGAGPGTLAPRGLLSIALVLPLVLPPSTFAAPGQTAFRLTRGGAAVTLDYRIEDPDGKAHRLVFSLPTETLQRARGRFKAYDPSELQREADAETLRQIEAAVGQLRDRYPQTVFEVRADLSIHWTVGSPRGFEERQQAIYDQRLASEISDLRAEYPGATIESKGGRFVIQAPDEAQLHRIEQRLLAAQRSANQALADYARQVKGDVDGDAQAIGVRIESDLAAIQQRVRDFTRGFFRKRLYILSDNQVLRPDYVQIAGLAVGDLAPAAAAIRRWTQGMGRRETLDYLLLFIQSIPYDRLEDRRTDTGFLLPALLLSENRGDCDSKAVTFAALAHLLYPDLPIAMVLLPKHAYLALGLAPEPGDQALKLDGKAWTVAEAAGPGLLPVGRLSGTTQARGHDIKSVVPLFH